MYNKAYVNILFGSEELVDIIHEKDSLLACLRIKFEAVVYVQLSPCCNTRK